MAVNRNRILKAADKYTRQGKLEAAVSELLKLIQDNPRDTTTINRVGDLYARLGRTKEAVEQFSRIADSYTREGFLLKAIAIYKKITKLDTGSLDAYHALARLYSQQGLTMEARAQFQTVAEQHAREGRDAQALATFREMLELDPQDLKVRLTIAGLLERSGDAGEALAAYQDAGAEFERRGMHADARKVCEAALRLAPGDPALVRRLVLCLRRQGASAEALGYLAGLLESRPDDPDLLSLVGDAHLDSGDRDQAVEMYEQARKAAPDRPENHLNEARLALHGQNVDASFQHLEQVTAAGTEADRLLPCVLELLDARPHHAGALRLLVDVHESSGNQAPARDACIRLAGACMEQGSLHDAAAALERLIRMDPENPRHQERLQDVVARIRQQGGTYPVDGGEPAAVAAAPPEAPVAAAPPPPVVEDPPEVLEGVDVAADIERVLPAEEELDADFIAEHMTEAEVFVKYGLVDRAVDQFRQVVERYPAYLPAHEGLLAIHREAGDRAAAAEAYRNIARIHEARGETEEAAAAFRQAGELSPVAEAATSAPAAPKPGPGTSDASPPAGTAAEDAAPAEPLQALTAAAGDREGGMPENLAAAAESASVPAAADAALPADAIEAVDALIEGGALGEARRRLEELAGAFPGGSELEGRLRRIDSMEARAREIEGRELPEGADGLDLFDLAAELDDSLFEATGEPQPEPEAEGHSLEDLVAAFKKGVEQEVDADDFETHYNLAIAYREMGLIDEAIGEFQVAAKSSDFFVKCCSMLGFCFREKGMTDLAVKWYSRGIEKGAGDEEALLGLRYDLAALLQEAGDGQRAMELFTEIYGANAKYRDVAERLSCLRESASGS